MSAAAGECPTLFLLMGTTPYVPLYWVSWRGARIVCRLISPKNHDHCQRLLDVSLVCEPLRCMMKDPLHQCWWRFDAYLTEIQVHDEMELTFVPTGGMQASKASHSTPPRARQQRRDAGQPRKRKPVPVEREGD